MDAWLEVGLEQRKWIEQFEHRHGRVPRVLHIGNIANNAYLNAKVLNNAGIHSDVLCHDYYHCMACPEWEDADYEGDIRDPLHPAWDRVDLKGFSRPDWFVQGPFSLCIEYLLARCRGHAPSARRWWRLLETARHACCAGKRGERNLTSFLRTGRYLLGRAALRLPGLPARIVRGLAPSLRDPFDERVAELIARFTKEFPERADALDAEDLELYRLASRALGKLLPHYDVVIGYSTDGVYPLLTGFRPYLVYEHGTIRNIPQTQTGQGRVCALTYRCADEAFITNCDNGEAAKRLALPHYCFLPHAMNESKSPEPAPEVLRQRLCQQLQSDFIVFHPSRQHWSANKDTEWEKGNDIFLRGFAAFVRETCPKAAAILIEWGQSVQASKELLQQLGAAERVHWIPSQKFSALLAYMGACDVVADQFTVGVFGGITPKALFMGRPALLRFDPQVHAWCFPEMPPVLDTRTDRDVTDALTRLYTDPDHARDVGERSADWYRRYYSNQVVLERMLASMSRALDETKTDPIVRVLPGGDARPLAS